MSASNPSTKGDEENLNLSSTSSNKQNGNNKNRKKNKEKQKQKQKLELLEPKSGTDSSNLKVKTEASVKAKKKRSKKSQNKNVTQQSEPQENISSTVDNNSALSLEDAKKLKKKRKRQLQKEKKKQLLQERRKKIEKPRLPVHKITIRNLPPDLSKKSFMTKVVETNPQLEACITEYYYVNGYYPKNQFESSIPSRCYISCSDEATMMQVGRAIKLMTFTDDIPLKPETDGETTEGNSETVDNVDELETYIPVIEKSLYQVMPEFNALGETTIDKWDILNDKLPDDFAFKRFCDSLNSEGKIPFPENIFSKGNKQKKKDKSTLNSVKEKVKKSTKTTPDAYEQSSEGKIKKKQKKRNKKKAKSKKEDSDSKEGPEKRADSDKNVKDTKKKVKKFKKKILKKTDNDSTKNIKVQTVTS